MKQTNPAIYGIGNPLIDIVIQSTHKDLSNLSLNSGVMHLVDEKRQQEILNYFQNSRPQYFPGGSAPNTMVACAGLGTSSLIAGKIGHDQFGDIYSNQVEKYGVLSGLVRGDGPTGSSIILVTPDGERTMNTHLGMCREFSENDVDEKILSNATYFYFTGYMWDTESQKAAIQKAIQISKRNDVQIIFDVADPFAVDRNVDEFLYMIEHDVDIVFANHHELNILFGSDNVDECGKKLSKIVSSAGIKLGKEGSMVIEGGQSHLIPPQPILAKDSTGAGDMYAAGFLAALSNGLSMKKAGEIGGELAEEIIQQSGAQFSLERIHALKKIVFK